MKDYLGYEGKVCVVTGAASGVGEAITEALVDLGAIVYALDRNPVKVPGIKEFIQVNLGMDIGMVNRAPKSNAYASYHAHSIHFGAAYIF